MRRAYRAVAGWPWEKIGRGFLAVWVLAWSLVVALLLADKLGEPGRQRQAIVGFCTGVQAKAYAPLTPSSGEFARNDVRSAISVYGIAQCPTYTGDLDPARVSPEAFRPAPPPPTPTPTRTGR